MQKIAFTFGLLLVALSSGWGQSMDIYQKYGIYRNPFRVFINKFSWNVSTGYAATHYKHQLDGYYFFQDAQRQMILSDLSELGNTFPGYSGWFSNPYFAPAPNIDDPFDFPYQPIPDPVNNPVLGNRQVLVRADSLELGFGSLAGTLPVMVSTHYNFGKFRIGGGFQYERHWLNPLKPTAMEDAIRPYEPEFQKTRYIKLFGLAGYQFYEWWDYTFVLEVQMGRAKAGPQINTTALAIGQNFYSNVGISIERHFSEYLRLTVRPSYDIKGYTINMPDGTSLKHRNRAYMVQVGMSINIPEIPRSPMKSDHVQLKHVIVHPGNGTLIEVRGQPLWKKQNPKMGENHRRLWKYKLRNRRKLDPY